MHTGYEILNVTCINLSLSKTLYSARELEVTLTELQYHTVIPMQKVQYERSDDMESFICSVQFLLNLHNQQLFWLYSGLMQNLCQSKY